MMKKIIFFVTFLFLFTFNSFALEIKPFGIELGKKLEVEFIEELGSWKKIVPPITNSNFKEYYVLVSPYSHIAMSLEARGDEKLQTLTCMDLYKKLAKILIKKYDLDVYTESEHFGYETKLISKDLNINISCVTHNIGGNTYKVSRIIYIYCKMRN